MNNYFNFTIPDFNQRYGEDWVDFLTIVEDNVDYMIKKTVDLYRLNDITRTPLIATEYIMRLLGLAIEVDDTLPIKKYKIRTYNATAKAKATNDLYLDYAENVVGIRGVIYNGQDIGSFVHDESAWPDSDTPNIDDWVWANNETRFQVYIDVKTLDDDLLDQIQTLYREDFILPAFYSIYLIDSDFNILRSI